MESCLNVAARATAKLQAVVRASRVAAIAGVAVVLAACGGGGGAVRTGTAAEAGTPILLRPLRRLPLPERHRCWWRSTLLPRATRTGPLPATSGILMGRPPAPA